MEFVPYQIDEKGAAKKTPAYMASFYRCEKDFGEAQVVELDMHALQQNANEILGEDEAHEAETTTTAKRLEQVTPYAAKRLKYSFPVHLNSIREVPREIMYLRASSTVISRKVSSCSGTMIRYPDVGLGVVGMKTAQTVSPSPVRRLVMNPMARLPLNGNSTRTTSLKAFLVWEENASVISFTEL